MNGDSLQLKIIIYWHKKAWIKWKMREAEHYTLCVFSVGGQVKGGNKGGWTSEREKGGHERAKKEQATVTADEALWDKHRSSPCRIKEQIQMAGAACCSALDCSYEDSGQQVICFVKRVMQTHCMYICITPSHGQIIILFPTGFNNEWLVANIKRFKVVCQSSTILFCYQAVQSYSATGCV